MSRGLFLDFDGTLVDSVPALRGAYERICAGFGVLGTPEEFDRCNGLPLREIVALLERDHGIGADCDVDTDVDADEMFRRYRSDVVRSAFDAPPQRGARELLATAQSLAIPVAVVTSAPASVVQSWLARNELEPWVAFVIGGDGVQRGKPAPEPYLAALEQSRCEAKESLAVEDSRIGAESATAAGIPTWFLGSPPEDRRQWPPVAGFVDALGDISALLQS